MGVACFPLRKMVPILFLPAKVHSYARLGIWIRLNCFKNAERLPSLIPFTNFFIIHQVFLEKSYNFLFLGLRSKKFGITILRLFMSITCTYSKRFLVQMLPFKFHDSSSI